MVYADASPISSARLQLRSGSHIPATGARPTIDVYLHYSTCIIYRHTKLHVCERICTLLHLRLERSSYFFNSSYCMHYQLNY